MKTPENNNFSIANRITWQSMCKQGCLQLSGKKKFQRKMGISATVN